MSQLNVEIWSDIACPWCFVGKRRLESALARFAHRDQVQITWRAFQLDPSAPPVREPESSYAERLARKYGTTPAQAQQMIDRMVGVARAEGLAFDFTRIRPGNTFDAHRLLHLAKAHGLQDALKERMFRGYLEEGKAIGTHEALRSLCADVALDADAVEGVLATDLYAAEVRADLDEARALGVDGVPFFLLGRRYAVSGAQPAELLLSALQRAWDERPPERLASDEAEGSVCGPDGCA